MGLTSDRKYNWRGGLFGGFEAIGYQFLREALSSKDKTLQQQKLQNWQILSALKDKFGTSADDKRLWHQIVTNLQEDVGLTGTKLLDQTNLLGTQNGKATITAENSFSAQWIERRFSAQIQALLKEHGRPVDKLKFVDLSSIGKETS